MHARIRTHEARLPIHGWPCVIVSNFCCLIVLGSRISEDFHILTPKFSTSQREVEIVPHLVTHVSDQRPQWLTQIHSRLFALNTIGFGNVDSDHSLVVSCVEVSCVASFVNLIFQKAKFQRESLLQFTLKWRQAERAKLYKQRSLSPFQIAPELLEFIGDAELIIHNAPFDVAFLDAELKRLPGPVRRIVDLCKVLDTLALARKLHPGQRNNLDALCKRYSVDNSNREFHGALLDARILLDVYLAMTGGQGAFTLGDANTSNAATTSVASRATRPSGELKVMIANASELASHESALLAVDKASGGKTLWRSLS